MSETLLLVGIACLIGAIVGGGLKVVHVELPVVASVRRQVLLGATGIALIAASFIVGGGAPSLPTLDSGDGGIGAPDIPNPDIAISVHSGPPGTALVVNGAGFAPGERVVIRFHTQELTRVDADAEGRFSGVGVQIPSDWPFTGQFDIVATGDSSLALARIPFEVR